jgi:BatD DUF11 like domain
MRDPRNRIWAGLRRGVFPIRRLGIGSLRVALFLVFGFGIVLAPRLVAAEVGVTADLTRDRINQGEMTELQIRVTGSQQADPPREILADGLQIRLTGQSTQVQMVNFKVSSSVIYSYIVMPLRTGSFTIPGVNVTVEGRSYRTAQLSLTVEDGRNAAPPAPPAAQAQLPMPGFQRRQRTAPQRPDAGRLAFGEIICPKRSLYAGEMVPVEIRYYFDGRYPVQVLGRVDFGGEGILVERFPDPKESREERDGQTYNVLTFHSLLSAVKPGPIDIPPAKLQSQIQMPASLPGFDDPVFQQLMGGQPGFSESKELTVKTAPLHLEVLPLPKEGRPASFGGAVGQFDIDAIVSNPKPAPGDPLNLVVKIGGRGNFKAMGAPVLTGQEGWRSYPPSDKFDGTDELSHTGVKSFDFTLIAQEPKHASPGTEFSYFDPVSAKYVTLSTKPLPVNASPGGSAPSPVSGASASPSPSGSPAPVPSPRALVAQGEPLPGLTLRSWKTPAYRTEFLMASLAMLAASSALAVILYLRDLRLRGGGERTRRRRRIAELLARLESGEGDAASFYDAALEYMTLALSPSPRFEELTARLSDRRDRLKYGIGTSRPIPDQERAEILASLRELSATDHRP